MNESFETVELTEGGDLHGVGEPGENEQHVFTRYAISHFSFFYMNSFSNLKVLLVKMRTSFELSKYQLPTCKSDTVQN